MDKQIFDNLYKKNKHLVDIQLKAIAAGKKPQLVYKPIHYVLEAGGKKVRSAIVMMACGTVGGNPKLSAPAAAAIELFHNFTLVHDDVMDNSDLRRGLPTVHKKWNVNVAILSGDELIAQAYELLLKTKSQNILEITKTFTDALVQVCEGQGYDKEFETRTNLTVEDYLMMIYKKTARLFIASAEIGGLIGNGNKGQIIALRKFGEHLGLAFQIQDDLLDICSNQQELGKPIGGDIKEGKKTFLMLTALQRVHGDDLRLLKSVKPGGRISHMMVTRVFRIYESAGILKDAKDAIAMHIMKAQRALQSLPTNNAKLALLQLTQHMLDRNK